MWTDTLVDVMAAEEDSEVVTAPFMPALPENPTTIFDGPRTFAQGSHKISLVRRLSEHELARSYEAALRALR